MENRIILILIGLILSTLVLSAVKNSDSTPSKIDDVDEVNQVELDSMDAYVKRKQEQLVLMDIESVKKQNYLDSLREINKKDCGYLKKIMAKTKKDVNTFISNNNNYMKQLDSLETAEDLEMQNKRTKFNVVIKNTKKTNNTVDFK